VTYKLHFIYQILTNLNSFSTVLMEEWGLSTEQFLNSISAPKGHSGPKTF